MARQTERTMLLQGTILASASILTKLIGFFYRIPMANLLGSEGNGLYSVAYNIYNIALTLSSCSLPLAVSKLVSARLARGERRNARRVFWDTVLFAVVMGGIAAAVLWTGADWLEKFYDRDGLAIPLRVLSPTTFVVALLGTFRGWFQGHGSMVPTALSQILEQGVNAVVSLAAAWQLMQGMKTLGVRMERHCENAMKVARYLEKHPKVDRVYYPGLESHPTHEIAKKQMHGGFGGMMSVDIKGGVDAVRTVMNNVKVFSLATSLGNVDSLIQHSPTMSHFDMTPEERYASEIYDGQVRLSIGIEDADDLIADLEQALALI